MLPYTPLHHLLLKAARLPLVMTSGNLSEEPIATHNEEALARLASAFYGNPSSSLILIGITGTNGKTTTSYLLESILKEDGKKVGVMGTVNYRFQGRVFPAPTTTPESLDLQKNLQAMRESGITHAVLEVSSHALDLQRVRGCDFDVALFTNLTRDHLDYHTDFENYFQAKQRLLLGMRLPDPIMLWSISAIPGASVCARA
jgi:UDP-N-acetylmuramyl tripeptide synthase